jgi:hypothetical protein
VHGRTDDPVIAFVVQSVNPVKLSQDGDSLFLDGPLNKKARSASLFADIDVGVFFSPSSCLMTVNGMNTAPGTRSTMSGYLISADVSTTIPFFSGTMLFSISLTFFLLLWICYNCVSLKTRNILYILSGEDRRENQVKITMPDQVWSSTDKQNHVRSSSINGQKNIMNRHERTWRGMNRHKEGHQVAQIEDDQLKKINSLVHPFSASINSHTLLADSSFYGANLCGALFKCVSL